ncbi:hypothetical protein AVEN_6028-1 [Araneus ventricosus]|uniref:Uncharacterized protein n=1 Tax=Araneus ventricosus TaxID=182803 RepID=A0A4Y2HRV0_ARAVE|nr:hypothetical protein AVEN_6028-1 [Araneus ventricosus]
MSTETFKPKSSAKILKISSASVAPCSLHALCTWPNCLPIPALQSDFCIYSSSRNKGGSVCLHLLCVLHLPPSPSRAPEKANIVDDHPPLTPKELAKVIQVRKTSGARSSSPGDAR